MTMTKYIEYKLKIPFFTTLHVTSSKMYIYIFNISNFKTKLSKNYLILKNNNLFLEYSGEIT